MTEREKIAARIRALLEKTVANGCTEDEAVAAASKAAELLDRYNMTMDEATLRASPFERSEQIVDDDVGARLWKPATAIAKLTNTKFWTARPGEPYASTFFGFAHEVEIARYMLSLCEGAMRREQERLSDGWVTRSRYRRAVLPFLDGMADRLRERILALVPEKPPGTGLVVVHDALVKAEMKERGIELTDGRARNSRSWEPGYGEGRAAADKVALNAGLGGDRATQKALR